MNNTQKIQKMPWDAPPPGCQDARHFSVGEENHLQKDGCYSNSFETCKSNLDANKNACENRTLQKRWTCWPVDVSEIRRSPVDMVNIPVFYKVSYVFAAAGFLPSTGDFDLQNLRVLSCFCSALAFLWPILAQIYKRSPPPKKTWNSLEQDRWRIIFSNVIPCNTLSSSRIFHLLRVTPLENWHGIWKRPLETGKTSRNQPICEFHVSFLMGFSNLRLLFTTHTDTSIDHSYRHKPPRVHFLRSPEKKPAYAVRVSYSVRIVDLGTQIFMFFFEKRICFRAHLFLGYYDTFWKAPQVFLCFATSAGFWKTIVSI